MGCCTAVCDRCCIDECGRLCTPRRSTELTARLSVSQRRAGSIEAAEPVVEGLQSNGCSARGGRCGARLATVLLTNCAPSLSALCAMLAAVHRLQQIPPCHCSMSSHRPPLPPPPSDSHSTGVRTRVLQHHYNALSQKWTKTQSEIVMDDKPFAEGQCERKADEPCCKECEIAVGMDAALH